MPLKTSFRARRLNKYQSKYTQKLVTFCLRQQWFAFPLKSVVKVITVDKFYCDLTQMGVTLTTYQNQEVLILDLGYYLFLEQFQFHNNTQLEYLILLQNQKQEILGIPVASLPVIRGCDNSAFKKSIKIQLQSAKISSLSVTIVEIKNNPLIFLLNPEQIFLMNN